MRNITYEQAKKYRPGMYDVNVVEVDRPSCAMILDYASDKALKILNFLVAWSYYNGHMYDAYYDTEACEVVLCIKNKEYHTVWRDK